MARIISNDDLLQIRGKYCCFLYQIRGNCSVISQATRILEAEITIRFQAILKLCANIRNVVRDYHQLGIVVQLETRDTKLQMSDTLKVSDISF